MKLVLVLTAAVQNYFYAIENAGSERFLAQFHTSKSFLQDPDHYLNTEHNEVTINTSFLCLLAFMSQSYTLEKFFEVQKKTNQ